MPAALDDAGEGKLASMQCHMLLNPPARTGRLAKNFATLPQARVGAWWGLQLADHVDNLRIKEELIGWIWLGSWWNEKCLWIGKRWGRWGSNWSNCPTSLSLIQLGNIYSSCTAVRLYTPNKIFVIFGLGWCPIFFPGLRLVKPGDPRLGSDPS